MIYIDFSDTPQGSDLIEKLQELENDIEDLMDQVNTLERHKDQLQSEYDCLEEMWEDSFEEDDE